LKENQPKQKIYTIQLIKLAIKSATSLTGQVISILESQPWVLYANIATAQLLILKMSLGYWLNFLIHMKIKGNMIRSIDLFAGIGGIRLGFDNACNALGYGTECVLSSEIDEQACETYYMNFKEKPQGDIHNITDIDD